MPSFAEATQGQVRCVLYYSVTHPLVKGSEHTIFAPTPIELPVPHTLAEARARFLGPEFSDAECRRESRQALTSSTATRGLDDSEDYSEFLICRVGRAP